MRLTPQRILGIAAVLCCAVVPVLAHANISDDIAAKQRQIQELQLQIAEYQRQADEVGTKSRTLENEIAKLNAQIYRIELEVRQLETNIDKTGLEIERTSGDISTAEEKLGLQRDALATYLRETASIDQESLAQILLKHDALSDFFDYVHQVQRTQDNLRLAIRSIIELREELEVQKEQLEGERTDLEQLRALQEIQQRQLAGVKGSKNAILRETKGQEAQFQKLIQARKTDLNRLQEQIFYLQKNGISVQDAATYAKLAAVSAGIRPAFLLALLEVESRLGQNIGTGNWMDDMVLCYERISKLAKTAERRDYYLKRAATEKAAFIKITGDLGLDPNAQKVSKEPTYGCGGAMGPAQFIPSTWLSYAGEIARLTGDSPVSPWNTEHAFTAAAIKLARGGASSQTREGEIAAAKAYISGNPNCTQAICYSYSSSILQKAATIEESL
jgi:membrane-bound lytic murein transglycosylase B